MATMNTTGQAAPIYYFDFEGRRNLDQVLRIVKKVLKKREELRHLKIVFFTAEGHGRALAYNRLREFRPKIIAVTFRPTFQSRSQTAKNGIFRRFRMT